MGLFTSDTKVEAVKRSKESKKGGKYLMNLLEEGTPDIPARSIADLSPIQQLIQEALGDMLAKSGESTALARKTYTDTLKEEVDPAKSKEYRGFVSEAERLKKKGITGVRQSAEGYGMFGSSPQFAGEGAVSAAYDSNILQLLGQLEREGRDRKERAAGNLQNVESQNIGNVAAIGGVAEIGRQVEQMRSDALYTAALAEVMFPYTEMSNIASILLSHQNQGVVTGGGLTDLGFFVSALTGGLSSYAGAGGRFGGGTTTGGTAGTASSGVRYGL